ncbi:ABC transporter substrate-binding protein [Georgenia deserti]|uniref:ABC transporter substrate-binding protein n=1 Tax=Georgenia deserti TaxID=2093781 RepID=A0ABW4L3Y4_9MICO
MTWVATAGVLALGLTACGPSEGGQSDGDSESASLRIAWSGSDDRTQRTEEALDLYREQHPEVDIQVEFTTSTNFWDRLTTQVAGGNAPDIIQMSGQTLAEYASSDVLLDLEPYVGEQIDIDGWDQELLDRQTLDGTLYGVPPGVDAHGLIYNVTKFDELGIDPLPTEWSWSDYREIVNAISEAGGDAYYGSEDGGSSYEAFQTFLAQRGKTLFNGPAQAAELGFESDDLHDWWQMWGELQEQGAVVPPDMQTEFGLNPENSGVIQDYAAMDWTTSSQFTNFVGLTDDELDITTYPFGPNGTPGQVWRAGLAWSITSSSEHPDVAADLINFLVNDESAARAQLATRGVPASPSAADIVRDEVDDTEIRSFEHLETVQELDAEITPLLPVGWGDFVDAYQRIYYEYAYGRMSLDDAVETFMTEASAAVES